MGTLLVGFLITMGLLLGFSMSAIFASIFGVKKVNNKRRGHGKAFKAGEKALAKEQENTNEMKQYNDQEKREEIAKLSKEEKAKLKEDKVKKEQEEKAKQEQVVSKKQAKEAKKLAKQQAKEAKKLEKQQQKVEDSVSNDAKEEAPVAVEEEKDGLRKRIVKVTESVNDETASKDGKEEKFVIPQVKQQSEEETKFVIPQIKETDSKASKEEDISLDYLKQLMNKNKKSNAYLDELEEGQTK